MICWCCRRYLTHVGTSQKLGGDGCNKSKRFFKFPLIFYREVKTRENLKATKATHKNPKVKLFFQKWDVGVQWSAKTKTSKRKTTRILTFCLVFLFCFVLLRIWSCFVLFCFFLGCVLLCCCCCCFNFYFGPSSSSYIKRNVGRVS